MSYGGAASPPPGLPEAARAEPDGGRRVRPFLVHALRAAEVFEQEVEVVLRGLVGQLVQQLLGRGGLGERERERGRKKHREVKRKERRRAEQSDPGALRLAAKRRRLKRNTSVFD